ncbi:histidinol-phosphatase HisJ family protein [Priestia megaterium]
MYLVDYHHHTNNSFDSQAVMKEVCEQAVKNGINEICFTEHFSLNPLAPTYGHMDFDKYERELAECRNQFQGQLVIKKGIEICEPHYLKEKYQETMKQEHFDFILGSVHNINNIKLRKHLELNNKEAIYRAYFNEMYKLVSEADIDVLAHLDLMKRYAFEQYGIYDFHQFKDILADILKKAIDRNIGIEINTSGMRGKLGEALPALEVVGLYRDLGGEILTIGSDSHFAETAGAHMKEAVEMAKQCGFTEIYTFDQRKPKGIRI